MTIIILPDNEIRFSIGADTVAVAGLVCFEEKDHARMDVLAINDIGGETRIKCPKSMLPKNGTMIWAVTTTNAGCFWAYDLHTVHQHLKS